MASGRKYRVRHRHDARHHRRDVQRRRCALPRYSVHLVARRRLGAVPGRPHRRRIGHRRQIVCPTASSLEAKKFYYDLAGAANRGAVASLLQLVTPAQILFGTDFPPGGTSVRSPGCWPNRSSSDDAARSAKATGRRHGRSPRAAPRPGDSAARPPDVKTSRTNVRLRPRDTASSLSRGSSLLVDR